jgi:arylformamidase
MIKKEKQYKLLSYPLRVDTHGYGGERLLRIKRSKMISRGDSCNTAILVIPNHLGTHIDCPNHFFNSGKKICEYEIKDFIFLHPILLSCPKSMDELVTEKDIKGVYQKLKKADILLIRTGFYKYRGTDKYSMRNPGISPEAAKFIRSYLKNIRCIGIDSISVSAYQSRYLGRQTHKIFFSNKLKNKPIRLIEDMNLSGDLRNLKEVYVSPFFIKEIDSSPCTVLGILEG